MRPYTPDDAARAAELDAREGRPSAVEWTDAEREAVERAVQRDVRRLSRKAPEDGTDEEGFVLRIADRTLDALAPFVEAREEQAAAKAEERVKQAIRECHDDPAKAVFDADRLAGEAIIRAHTAEAERDVLAERLRQRSAALDRVVAEVERLRATVARVEALLAEYERMCQPAPYTSERALVERLHAALAGESDE